MKRQRDVTPVLSTRYTATGRDPEVCMSPGCYAHAPVGGLCSLHRLLSVASVLLASKTYEAESPECNLEFREQTPDVKSAYIEDARQKLAMKYKEQTGADL